MAFLLTPVAVVMLLVVMGELIGELLVLAI